ncbi:MAG: (Fe-S)-binding protein [Proteobacteria bacterium]|nr:(Fe-S)-binding protein [Pseudomonadota bacterium]
MSFPSLQRMTGEIEKCFRCSLCKMVPLPVFKKTEFSGTCPINNYYKFHHYSCSGMEYMGLALAEGRIEADERLADIVFSCRTCGYCDVACKFIMEVERDKINMVLRETLVEQGLAPEESKTLVQNLRQWGNPSGIVDTKTGDWAEGLDLKKMPEQKAKVLLFTGCSTLFDTKIAGTARQFASILKSAGVDFGILGDDELCCGLPAHWTGFRQDFEIQARKNISSLRETGAKTIVTLCGACLGTLRSKYPEYGIHGGLEIVHATEYLEKLIRKRKIKFPGQSPFKVSYHDPCYLGRKSEPYVEWEGLEKKAFGQMVYHTPPKKIRYGTEGVYDSPRTILKAIGGLTFTEMFRTREYALCCGGGGGNAEKHQEMAIQAAVDRLDEALAVGAETLVTSCAHCRRHFEKAKQKSDREIKIMDIIELVYHAAKIE